MAMLVVTVPHLDAKRQVCGNVVQVGICELAQHFVHAEVKL